MSSSGQILVLAVLASATAFVSVCMLKSWPLACEQQLMTILDRVQSYAKWFHLKDIFQLQKNNLGKRFCSEVLAEIPFMQPGMVALVMLLKLL